MRADTRKLRDEARHDLAALRKTNNSKDATRTDAQKRQSSRGKAQRIIAKWRAIEPQTAAQWAYGAAVLELAYAIRDGKVEANEKESIICE